MPRPALTLALKIDVDTHRGFREGVPRLIELLRAAGVAATFFLTFGPDRSGRAALRVFRKKGFLSKMLRTGPARMYGWRTLFYGTLLPSPLVAAGDPALTARLRDEGHEVGVHAWDHVRWQDRLERMERAEIDGELDRAFAAYRAALAEEPRAMAAPGWIVTAGSLRAQDRRGLRYASDVRGPGVFRPVLDGYRSTTPQVGTTLPTLDELLGLDGVTEANFNDRLLDRMAAEPGPHVYTLHAETEGLRYADSFQALLRAVARRFDVRWLRVGDLFDEAARAGVPDAPLEQRAIPGRSGLVACWSA